MLTVTIALISLAMQILEVGTRDHCFGRTTVRRRSEIHTLK